MKLKSFHTSLRFIFLQRLRSDFFGFFRDSSGISLEDGWSTYAPELIIERRLQISFFLPVLPFPIILLFLRGPRALHIIHSTFMCVQCSEHEKREKCDQYDSLFAYLSNWLSFFLSACLPDSMSRVNWLIICLSIWEHFGVTGCAVAGFQISAGS